MSDFAMFDKDGWLCLGTTGLQPELAESYINIYRKIVVMYRYNIDIQEIK